MIVDFEVMRSLATVRTYNCASQTVSCKVLRYHTVPWKTVVLEQDDRFEKTDPGPGQNGSLIWHEIKPSR